MFKKTVLQFIGILVLIDHNIFVTVAGLFSQCFILIQDLIGKHEQVIKIDKVVLFYICLVLFIDLCYLFIVGEFSFLNDHFRGQ